MKDHLISRNKFLDALVLDADHKTDLIQVHQALEKAVVEDINVPCKWISVKDKLPEKNGGVIVRVENGNIYSSVYAVNGGFRCAATHWMPLPEPPKGVE